MRPVRPSGRCYHLLQRSIEPRNGALQQKVIPKPHPSMQRNVAMHQRSPPPSECDRQGIGLLVILGAALGMMLEWYDFIVYGLLAQIVANVFFPVGPDMALFLSAATFGVGFVTRPLGAVVLGRYADRAGRRRALAWTMGLMALGTACIGLAPGYATIGLLAPFIVVTGRLLQGFAAAGEFAGATTFLLEHAPRGRRGLYASFQQSAQFLAALLGSATGIVLVGFMPRDALQQWGWRIPFLVGLLVGPLGIWLRARAPEVPGFRPDKTPLRFHLRAILAGSGITIFATACAYVTVIYLPIWVQRNLGLPIGQGLEADAELCTLLALLCPLAGWLSDRISRRRLAFIAVLCLVLTGPALSVVAQAPNLGRLCLVAAALAFPLATLLGVLPALMAETLPASVRGLGVSVSYNLAVMLFGGFAPATVEALSHVLGGTLAITAYLGVAAIPGLLGLAWLPHPVIDETIGLG
jgi:MFS transporter, MHS family, proline/betaine transporter